MDKITADWKKLSEDGANATRNHLSKAIDSIDSCFGKGYAKQHPELVGAFIQAAAIDAQGCVIAQAIQEFAEKLSKANSEIGTQIFNIYDYLRIHK